MSLVSLPKINLFWWFLVSISVPAVRQCRHGNIFVVTSWLTLHWSRCHILGGFQYAKGVDPHETSWPLQCLVAPNWSLSRCCPGGVLSERITDWLVLIVWKLCIGSTTGGSATARGTAVNRPPGPEGAHGGGERKEKCPWHLGCAPGGVHHGSPV